MRRRGGGNENNLASLFNAPFKSNARGTMKNRRNMIAKQKNLAALTGKNINGKRFRFNKNTKPLIKSFKSDKNKQVYIKTLKSDIDRNINAIRAIPDILRTNEETNYIHKYDPHIRGPIEKLKSEAKNIYNEIITTEVSDNLSKFNALHNKLSLINSELKNKGEELPDVKCVKHVGKHFLKQMPISKQMPINKNALLIDQARIQLPAAQSAIKGHFSQGLIGQTQEYTNRGRQLQHKLDIIEKRLKGANNTK
jgi:hypothetical protein